MALKQRKFHFICTYFQQFLLLEKGRAQFLGKIHNLAKVIKTTETLLSDRVY